MEIMETLDGRLCGQRGQSRCIGRTTESSGMAVIRVFSPGDTDIEDAIAEAYYTNGGHDPPNHGQFSNDRYAFLFCRHL